MCFSVTASFVAGGVLSATGVITIKQAKAKSDLPLASIPLFFGIQQTIEGVIWLSFDSPHLNTVMTYAYSIFSHVFWPIFVPLAVLLIETNPLRKKILLICSLVGFSVGIYFLYFIVTAPVTSQIMNRSIAYDSPHPYPFLMMALYLFAICGSCLFSSHKIINILGVVLSISFLVAVWFFYATFFSVWCFFAAILSFIVYLYFRKR